MLEELFAAMLIGLSFSNAFVCIFLAFGVSTLERKRTGVYFILGRFLGLMIIGLIIASIGFIFDSYKIYFMVLFGVLTMAFGGIVIFRMYYRIKYPSTAHNCSNCNTSTTSASATNCTSCTGSNGCSEHNNCNSNSQDGCTTSSRFCLKSQMPVGSKFTRRYSFLLGVFRGATPCLKIFILAPLLIIVDLWLALLMILVYALASTIYPVIGFLSANLLSNIRKYETHVQITGAIILISIGAYTIIKQLMTQSCTVGI
ncbi:hypothetical protein [[Eubacterium] cellulosolvens]